MNASFTPADLQALHNAHNLLNKPGLAAHMTTLIGTPIEKGLVLTPDNRNSSVGGDNKSDNGSESGHFTVRRLERRYGAEAIQLAYSQLGNGA